MRKFFAGWVLAIALIGGVATTGALVHLSAPVHAQEVEAPAPAPAPVAAPVAPASDAADSEPASASPAAAKPEAEKPDIVALLMETFAKTGPPTDFTIPGLIAFAVFFVVAFFVAWASIKFKDKANLVTALQKIDNIADQVYLEKIEGKDGKIDKVAVRDYGLALAKGAGKEVGALLLKEGPKYVIALIHSRANKKKQAAQLAKAAAASAS